MSSEFEVIGSFLDFIRYRPVLILDMYLTIVAKRDELKDLIRNIEKFEKNEISVAVAEKVASLPAREQKDFLGHVP